MKAMTPTTTLSELNRLYVAYSEAVYRTKAHTQEVQKAWMKYETYVERYKKERGMEDQLYAPFIAKTKIRAV